MLLPFCSTDESQVLLLGRIDARRPLQLACHGAGQHAAIHAKVAAQGPEGMSERGRFVAFEQTVTDPGEAITDREREQGPPRIEEQQRVDDPNNRQGRTAEVQSAVHAIAVLFDVKEPEVFVVLELHGKTPWLSTPGVWRQCNSTRNSTMAAATTGKFDWERFRGDSDAVGWMSWTTSNTSNAHAKSILGIRLYSWRSQESLRQTRY